MFHGHSPEACEQGAQAAAVPELCSDLKGTFCADGNQDSSVPWYVSAQWCIVQGPELLRWNWHGMQRPNTLEHKSLDTYDIGKQMASQQSQQTVRFQGFVVYD